MVGSPLRLLHNVPPTLLVAFLIRIITVPRLREPSPLLPTLLVLPRLLDLVLGVALLQPLLIRVVHAVKFCLQITHFAIPLFLGVKDVLVLVPCVVHFFV